MAGRGVDADVLSHHLKLQCIPSVVTARSARSPITVTLVECEQLDHAPTDPLPPDDGFLFGLQLKDCGDRDLWIDGERIETKPLKPGELVGYDLRRSTRWHLRTAFSALCIHLSRAALNALTDEAGLSRVRDFRLEPGVGIMDRTIHELGRLLVPAIRNPAQASRLYCDSLIFALCGHLAQEHAELSATPHFFRGGLAPWQERRAKELLDASITGNVQVSALAQECGLSVSQFSRSFRQSTGLAPHQWLTHRRVELAKSVLPDTNVALSEVGLICGFADQSHFTRVFSKLVGTSPGAWRRACA